ncbi:MAG: ATP-dependent zinc metalloprotease FtsH [Clostridia bacterium]|nr:ATP-dependent zinc metalloprotease FtsH [Clostridia bacterium]
MKKNFKSLSLYAILFMAILLLVTYLYTDDPESKIYSDFVQDIKNEKVEKLVVVDDTATVTLKGKKDDQKTEYEVTIPSKSILHQDVGEEILKQVEAKTLKYDPQPTPTAPWWLSMLPGFLMIILVVVFFLMFMGDKGGGGGRSAMSFGKSRAKINQDDKNVKFDDVAGEDEEKEELQEVVDFLKSPVKYQKMGARIPKGVLLVGPPGTGKTLLAKAVAGEAGVPFFSISGSDFVEMFVGVGASRVRDLFEQAKKNAPCIVFIDEIDAVGRKRGSGLGGGHDEREQTLNQLLVEMDGFGVYSGIIVIAATNRQDILDPALLRPGRFDRQVYVGYPDAKGREAILKVHCRNKPLADDVDLEVIAKTTVHSTGAELENIMNEAALSAVKKGQDKIHQDDISEAVIKVGMGKEKKSRKYTEKEKKLTAYHEAGHAVAIRLLPNQGNVVHQVTIIPRGGAGGFTWHRPTEDKFYASREEMRNDLVVSLGGRVAEKLVMDDISTGASADIQKVTQIARAMVTKYGMSEKLGPVFYDSENEEVFIGRDFGTVKNYSEAVAAQIDAEVRDIIEDAYKRCETLLSENMDKLVAVAEALLEKEKLEADEFEALFSGKPEQEVAEDVAEEVVTAEAEQTNSETTEQE